MSNQVERYKHSKRLAKKKTKLDRKMGIAKAYGWNHILENPHKYSKTSMFNCGNSSCFICGNPRKVFKEKTMQELKQELRKDDGN